MIRTPSDAVLLVSEVTEDKQLARDNSTKENNKVTPHDRNVCGT